jgi:tetratricopeptide (TPR) repeat protein
VDRRGAAKTAAGQSGVPRLVNAAPTISAGPQSAPPTRPLTVVKDDAGGAPETQTGGSWGTASGQVVVGAIPQRPPGFLPRPAPLKVLGQADRAGSVIQVVTGPHGAGKTQLAAAYARAKLAAGWRLVAWVNAEDAGSLLTGLAAVADAAGLADGASRLDGAEVARAVRRQLEVDGERCLVVLDHVHDVQMVHPFLPVGGAARVLITTTRDSVAELGFPIPVDAFSDQEALAFLDGRTGLGEEGAAAVAAEMGHLPLALAQAAAVMGGQTVAYEPYLQRLRTLPLAAYLTPERDQPYPPGFAEAVLLSLDAIQASDRTGVYARIITIMAVLSAAGARRDLLLLAGPEGTGVDGGPRLPADAVDQAIERMVDRSLLTISLDGQTVVVHRMVARVVREFLARGERLPAAYRAAASVLLARADALARSPDRRSIRDMAQQVSALIESVGRAGIAADEQLADVVLRLRFLELYYLMELGEGAPRAIALGESLTADLVRILGPGHPDTLTAQNNLAAAYRDAGRLTEAIALFERTLPARERALGAGHPDTLTSQHNLAAAYRDAGRLTEAIALFEWTLAARERMLGPGHPSTVNSLGNLATAYRDAGRWADAVPLLERTLSARENLLGPDHPSTQRSRNRLAGAYRKTGQVAKAIPLAEQILTSREQLLGADDPSTLAARNNLAEAYREAGQFAEAVPLFEQTLVACERMLGADDTRTVATRNLLTLAYQDAARAAKASQPEPDEPETVQPETVQPETAEPETGEPESVQQVGGHLQDDGA